MYVLPRKLDRKIQNISNVISLKLKLYMRYGLWLIFYFISAFLMAYIVYDTVEKEHDRLQRKQPGQFDHET